MAQSQAASFVAVDLGASGGKLTVGTFRGHHLELAEAHRFPNGGISIWINGAEGGLIERTYWDDLALYEHILEGLAKASQIAPAPIRSIGISTWGADAALLGQHGEPLLRLYNYRDHRLDGVPHQLAGRIAPRRIFELTGLKPQPWYLLNQLMWAVRNRAELVRAAQLALPVGGLLESYLCGAKVAEQNWMAAQGLTCAGRSEYCEEILAAAGIPRHILPPIAPPGTALGELLEPVARRTHLAGCRVVSVKAHDTACAYSAAPISDPRRCLIVSSGTWSLVGKLLAEPLLRADVFDAGLSNEGVAGDVRLLRNVMGTWPIQQLRQQWAVADGSELSWPQIVQLAEAAPPLATGIDVDDPALFNPPDMQAALLQQLRRTGQPAPEGRGPLLRAVYEGLALKVAQVNRQLADITGVPQDFVHVVGGGARNGLLNQFIADATGLPVLSGPTEATGIGNLLVQAVAAGVVESMEYGRRIVARSLPVGRCEPSGDRRAWSEAIARFEKLPKAD
jgi:rhamnulokinase